MNPRSQPPSPEGARLRLGRSAGAAPSGAPPASLRVHDFLVLTPYPTLGATPSAEPGLRTVRSPTNNETYA